SAYVRMQQLFTYGNIVILHLSAVNGDVPTNPLRCEYQALNPMISRDYVYSKPTSFLTGQGGWVCKNAKSGQVQELKNLIKGRREIVSSSPEEVFDLNISEKVALVLHFAIKLLGLLQADQ
ncbi:hypothetical protein Tco_1297985, partial [Tanacetum coccineum]